MKSSSEMSDNTGQQISNSFCVCDVYVINLLASIKLENGHKKNYLALALKLCYIMLFYQIDFNFVLPCIIV